MYVCVKFLVIFIIGYKYAKYKIVFNIIKTAVLLRYQIFFEKKKTFAKFYCTVKISVLYNILKATKKFKISVFLKYS